ncbi:MAG TPA: NIPSNAP family protein [Sphingopyxis sp.]|nr:NIPSNAP family protein [Sphingopyxis sp.]
MIVEMRTYQTKPGMRTRFVEIFETRTLPEHRRLGMAIAGPFLSVENPDVFFFMRGFPDVESRETMKAGFYEGRLWKEELEGVLMPMLERHDVVVVDDPGGRIAW